MKITLIISLLICMFLIGAFFYLLRKVKALRKLVVHKNLEIEEINSRNRYSLDSVECTLRDKTILLKKVISERNTAVTENEKLRLKITEMTGTTADTINHLQPNLNKEDQTNSTKESTQTENSLIHSISPKSQRVLDEFNVNITKLESLEKLLAEGIITADEYEEKRKKLIDKI